MPRRLRFLGPWILLVAFLLLLFVAGVHVIYQRWLADLAQANDSAKTELALLASLVRVDLQRGDYQAVGERLQAWAEKEKEITLLRVTAANGYVLSEFQRQAQAASRRVSFEETVPYSYRGAVRLELVRDISAVESQRSSLAYQVGTIYLVLAGLLAALTYNLQLRRRQSKLLVDRTESLLRANRELTAEANAHRQAALHRDRLISLVEATTDFVGTADPQGNVLYINRAGRAMLGVGDVEAASLRIDQLHPPAARRLILERGVPAAIRDGAWAGETALIGPDGREIPVSQVILSHRNERGEVAYLSTVIRDVSERHETQRRLEARDALLQRLSERVPGVIYQYRMFPDGRSCFPYASEGIRQIYAVAPQEVQDDATPVFNRLHPDDFAAVAKSITASFEALTPWRHEYRVVLPDRGVRWVRGESVPERLEDGSVLWHGYISDVTDLREAEQALRESETRFQTLLEVAPEAIVVHCEGRYIYANPAALDLIGARDPNAILGKEVLDIVHPDSHALVRERVERLVRGEPVPRRVWQRWARLDGTPIDVEVTALRFMLDGMPAVHVMARDITEQRQAEIRLRESEALLAEAQSLAHLGNWTLDLVTGDAVWSDEEFRLLGYEPGSVKPGYENFIAAVHPEDRSRVMAEMNRVMRFGESAPYHIEHRVVTPQGECVVEERGRMTFDLDGKPVRMFGTTLDITERKRAEEALARLAAIVGSSSDAIISRTPEGIILSWNAGAERLFGYTAAEVIGKDIRMTAPPWDPDQPLRNTRRLQQGIERIEPFETEVVAKDGRLVPVQISVSPVRDATGKLILVAGIMRDITERKRAEAALRQSEARLNEAQRIAQLGGWELDLGSNRLTWSEEVFRIFEVDPARFEASYESFLGAVHPEDRDLVNQAFLESVRTGQQYSVIHRLLMPDGRVKYVREIGETHLEKGQAVRTVGTVQDVTRIRLAELALQERERQLQLVTDNVPAMICYLDRELRFRFVNRRFFETLGKTAESILGKTLQEVVGETAFARSSPQFTHALAGHAMTYVLPMLVQTGEVRSFEIDLVPDEGVGGTVDGCYAMAVDITERLRAEEILRRANEELEDRVAARTRDLAFANRELEAFAYSVSHDLRTPLRGIDGFSRLLAERYGRDLGTEARGYLERIRAGAQRMGTLISDLLALSRVTRTELKRERVDLTALARSVASELAHSDPRRAVEWRIEQGLQANADPGQMRIVLENLLGNAWKYTANVERAVIEFFATQGEAGTEFCVRDNGAGFDMAYAGLLFKPFKRLHGLHEFEGTGVGLATVQRVIERHGGRVRGEGAVGRGATFYFSLPGA